MSSRFEKIILKDDQYFKKIIEFLRLEDRVRLLTLNRKTRQFIERKQEIFKEIDISKVKVQVKMSSLIKLISLASHELKRLVIPSYFNHGEI